MIHSLTQSNNLIIYVCRVYSLSHESLTHSLMTRVFPEQSTGIQLFKNSFIKEPKDSTMLPQNCTSSCNSEPVQSALHT